MFAVRVRCLPRSNRWSSRIRAHEDGRSGAATTPGPAASSPGVVMGSHRDGSTPARASAQVGDRRFACRYRVIDSTICRPSAAVRSPVNHCAAPCRTCSQASALRPGLLNKKLAEHALPLSSTRPAVSGRKSPINHHTPCHQQTPQRSGGNRGRLCGRITRVSRVNATDPAW
jgi:hypothetical protein